MFCSILLCVVVCASREDMSVRWIIRFWEKIRNYGAFVGYFTLTDCWFYLHTATTQAILRRKLQELYKIWFCSCKIFVWFNKLLDVGKQITSKSRTGGGTPTWNSLPTPAKPAFPVNRTVFYSICILLPIYFCISFINNRFCACTIFRLQLPRFSSLPLL